MKRLPFFVFIFFGCGFLLTANAYALVNVALTATATANSFYSSSSVPSVAIDGVYTTRWDAGDHGSATDPNWLIVDLGSADNIAQIHVFWGQDDGFYANYTNEYNFYTGLTGSDWVLQKSGVFVDESPNVDDKEFTLDFGIPELLMRYAKFEVVGGSHWSGVGEIEIFKHGTGAVPEPATIMLLGTGLISFAMKRRRH